MFINTFFILNDESLQSCPTDILKSEKEILFFSEIHRANAQQIFSITSFVRFIFSPSTPADHHGHVERMKGVMEAMGVDRSRLKIILVQLVRLMKNGEIVRMSKRTGKSVQLSDLLDEVGADAARFIFNTHESSSGMDFDLDLAVKKDMQNPLYYVQYAHARICSIFRQAKDNISEEINLNILEDESEKNLIYFMSLYPSELLVASLNYDPTKITRYVISLATLFHKFYSKCKVISDNAELTVARLCLCRCVQIIIKSILEMFKVDAPEVME